MHPPMDILLVPSISLHQFEPVWRAVFASFHHGFTYFQEHMERAHSQRFCFACENQIKRNLFQQHCVLMHNTSKARVQLKRLASDELER